jgi:hypothetical protein
VQASPKGTAEAGVRKKSELKKTEIFRFLASEASQHQNINDLEQMFNPERSWKTPEQPGITPE